MMNMGMMNPGMGMMNPLLLQQQQAIMNNLFMQQKILQGQQMNMFALCNAQQELNQHILRQQQIINNERNISNNQNPNYISILFQVQSLGNIQNYTIQCSLDDKVSTVIQQYRTKANDFDELSEKFIFNNKRLNETLTVAESGLINNSIVFVINEKGIKGGF